MELADESRAHEPGTSSFPSSKTRHPAYYSGLFFESAYVASVAMPQLLFLFRAIRIYPKEPKLVKT